MAVKNILTYNAKVSSVEQLYYAPVVTLPQANNIQVNSIYCFLSRTDPWGDDANPDQPTQTLKYTKQVMKNMYML
jgi:hypothetical protein